jgi:SNF2 family DNA or RNA helicase
VLVLCPKKLTRNWTIYRNPSSLNPFSQDKFRYDVLHHTDLSRTSGNVNGIHLDTLNWGAYDLVVIDESHNFRNNKLATERPGDAVERKSRYQRLMDDIISAGVRTKVLLLSATPVNNRRLQPFRYLHDCSGCFRLERLPGGACTHWKAPPLHGAHP